MINTSVLEKYMKRQDVQRILIIEANLNTIPKKLSLHANAAQKIQAPKLLQINLHKFTYIMPMILEQK